MANIIYDTHGFQLILVVYYYCTSKVVVFNEKLPIKGVGHKKKFTCVILYCFAFSFFVQFDYKKQ